MRANGVPARVLTANQVVSYRLREARLRRGWTQQEAAEHLAPYLGVRWSPASFSAAERAVDGGRVRQFSADDLLAFARAFELPLPSFLIPPPGVRVACPNGEVDGVDPVVIVDAVIGTAETFPLFEERLLASAVAHGRTATGPTELPPWLGASVRAAAQRAFGSTGDCIDALTRVAALLRELDGGPGRRRGARSVRPVPTSGPCVSHRTEVDGKEPLADSQPTVTKPEPEDTNTMTTSPTSTTAPPFDPTQPGVDGGPTVLLLGEPATGKSSTAKCIVGRLLASSAGGPDRVGIVDARGEYGALADALGLRRIVLRPGGPERLNPLDTTPGASGVEVEDRRYSIVAALCEVSLGRELGAAEQRAVRATVAVLPCWPHGQPVLGDVVALLAEPSAEMVEWATEEADNDQLCEWAEPVEATEMVEAAGQLAPALGRLLDGELGGCFDGSTTAPADGPGAVIDLTAFRAEETTLRLAALASLAWLETVEGRRRVNLLDEAWMLLGDEWATRYLVDWLERAEAATNIVITHRLSDLHRAAGDDARSLADRAQRFAGAFSTWAAFRLSDSGDVALARSALHITLEESGVLPELPPGLAMWKAAEGAVVLVQYRIGPDEWVFCDNPHTLAV